MLVNFAEAVRLLSNGQVVAVPTETVYGLAADAENEKALTLLYDTKGRPQGHPVILHVADLAMLAPYVERLPDSLAGLVSRFWPGPLTLLLPKTSRVSPRITGGRLTVGVRVPACEITRRLLRELGRPLVAPSANRFGHISPTTAQHVEDEFDGAVPVLDGGPCEVGVESTILLLEEGRLVIVRPGQLTQEILQQACDLPVVHPEQPPTEGVPGALKSHYAPRQPLYLLESEAMEREDAAGAAVIALTRRSWPKAVDVEILALQADQYGQALYGALRKAEATPCDRILVELPPSGEAWRAVRDRLLRASVRP